MDADIERYIERLLQASEKKCRLLEEILNLTEEQSGSISRDSVEKLGKLVSDKQVRIDEIDKLDEEFNVYFLRLKSELHVKSLDELKNVRIKGAVELKETIGKIVDLINKIGELEAGNKSETEKLLQTLENEMKRMNQAKKVNSAYASSPLKPPPFFFDSKK